MENTPDTPVKFAHTSIPPKSCPSHPSPPLAPLTRTDRAILPAWIRTINKQIIATMKIPRIHQFLHLDRKGMGQEGGGPGVGGEAPMGVKLNGSR